MWPAILTEIGNVPIEDTYRVLITNNILINILSLCYEDQCKSVLEIDCKVPKLEEYLALWIFQKICNDKWLCEKNSKTYQSSSTFSQGYRLSMGSSTSGDIEIVPIIGDYALQNVGVGGRRKFVQIIRC